MIVGIGLIKRMAHPRGERRGGAHPALLAQRPADPPVISQRLAACGAPLGMGGDPTPFIGCQFTIEAGAQQVTGLFARHWVARAGRVS